jgi:tRNA nucleotidyltransferase (CCA-adding enzyme)
MKALDTPPGPWMKSALDVVIEWQLRNPEITDPTTVIAELQSWKQSRPEQFAGKKRAQPDARKRKQGELSSALISHFLRLTIRLIFSQTRNPEITEAGRRNVNATVVGSSRPGIFDETEIPWKNSQAWALDLLSWTCKSLDQECVEREWGFLVPPVLSVLDDIDVSTKVKGCTLLRLVLLQTPPALLHRTGLIPVFRDSLLSCTTYLPTLTPAKDSAALIAAATPALLSLADAAYPLSPSSTATPPPTQRTELLLTVLRKAFISPFNHAREHVPVARALLAQLPRTLDALGVDAVVHLKDLVPLLAAVLDDPFGPAHPPLLLDAARALGAVLRNAWPRAWVWRADVLKGVAGLWIRLAGEEGDGPVLEKVKSECQEVVGMLDSIVRACGEDVDWDDEVAQIKAADDRLEDLFDLVDSTA